MSISNRRRPEGFLLPEMVDIIIIYSHGSVVTFIWPTYLTCQSNPQ